MQRIHEMLADEGVALDIAPADFDNLVSQLTAHLERNGQITSAQGEAMRIALKDRERLGTTSVGGGVMVPHAYCQALEHTVAGFARLKSPISYGPDGEDRVDLVLLLAGPESAQSQHLPLLAHIVRLFHDGQLLAGLRGATDPAGVLSSFRDAEERHG